MHCDFELPDWHKREGYSQEPGSNPVAEFASQRGHHMRMPSFRPLAFVAVVLGLQYSCKLQILLLMIDKYLAIHWRYTDLNKTDNMALF